MALNKYMHPRNIYKSRKPDFKVLASKYDYFKEKVTVSNAGKTILEFKDPAALRVLTRALLEDDFGLVVTIPLDRLIPTVPQRLNYILWLEDMIGKNNAAKGIDIGTGACCIYPLLGCRLNQWQFLASDIDDQNILFANKNISNNKLEEKITVKKVAEETILVGLIEDNESYDFCMCNPPFYSDHLEAQGITSSRNDDRSDASSVSTASEAESIAWGGEVRFVSQMIEESVKLKDRVRLFTSLLGKKTSLSLLKDVLSKNKISKYSTTEFCQGRTMRWGIAWTFDDSIQFPKSLFREKKNEKPPLAMELSRDSAVVVGDYTVQAYTWFIWKQLEDLKIYFHIKHSGKFYSCFFIKCMENTWSHQRRKKRKQMRESSNTESSTTKQNSDETKIKPEKETESEPQKETHGSSVEADVNKMKNVSEVSEKELAESGEKRKRDNDDIDTDSCAKKSKTEDDQDETIKSSEEMDASGDNNELEKLEDNNDEPNVLNRKEIIERFWKEKEANANLSAGKKKMEKSFYECLEPFKDEDECLLLSKVVIKKEEGVISLSLTHMNGHKEAMHQIMQYFKNKLNQQKKSD